MSMHMSRSESGSALISVIGFALVFLLLAGVAFRVALSAQDQAVQFSQYNAALAAADAGLDDYLARLNRRPGYYATATATTPGDNPALNGWADVQSSSGEYHIDVDASKVNSTGAVTVRSTGRDGGATRTVETTFRPVGFLDFIYFTQYEILDPDAFSFIPSSCADTYSYEGRSDSQCSIIRFVTGDTIQGPLHTNDRMVIDGDPVFTGEATTGYPGVGGWADDEDDCSDESGQILYRDQNGTSDPDFQEDLCYGGQLDVPPDNQSIQNQTTNVAGQPTTHGCSYYGPTYIRLYDPDPNVENDGRMIVRSPWATSGAPSGAIPMGPAGRCGSAAALASASGADLPFPPNGVVYVDDHTGVSCNNNAAGHPLNLPRPNDNTNYQCDAGDAFVWGDVDGQLTIGASNDINIVWDIEYVGAFPETDDLLGLVSNNNVQIYHPMDVNEPDEDESLDIWGTYNGNNLPPFIPGDLPNASERTWQDPMIHAAIMAVRHSFRVQNYSQGVKFSGDLSIRGAIAQKYRGAVGTGGDSDDGTGYLKDYIYDDRLQYLSPPYFVQPGGDTAWEAKTWAEIPLPTDLP